MTAISLLIILTTLFSAVLSGIFGMAGGLVMMGVLAWVLPAATALALHGVVQLASNLWRVVLHRRYVAWSILGWFALGAGTALAILSVVAFAPDKFYIFLMLGLLPLMVWLPDRWIRLDASIPSHAIACGLIANGLSITTGASGPLTDMFFFRTPLTRHQIVATKAVMQAMSHASKVITYGAVLTSAQSLAVVPIWVMVATLLTSMVGIMLGGWVLDRMSDAHFQSIRRLLVTALGVGFLVQAARMALA